MAAVGGGLGIVSSYMGYRTTVSSLNSQNSYIMANARLQQQQFGIQSAMQRAQAAAFMAQSGALSRQAAAYMQQSTIAAKTGAILQANESRRASQAQREGEESSKRASELRRQLIGEGKVKFAANGVLVEGRPQSAVAMWEQDEVADLAVELGGIKRQVDNEVFGYMFNGSQQRMQGLFDAQALKLQADASRIEAGTAGANAAGALAQSRLSQINAASAMLQARANVSQNNAAAQGALWGFIGSVAGIGSDFGTFMAGRSAYQTPAGGSASYMSSNSMSSNIYSRTSPGPLNTFY